MNNCPWCKIKTSLSFDTSVTEMGRYESAVVCDDCGGKGPLTSFLPTRESAEDKARQIWNAYVQFLEIKLEDVNGGNGTCRMENRFKPIDDVQAIEAGAKFAFAAMNHKLFTELEELRRYKYYSSNFMVKTANVRAFEDFERYGQ